MVSYNQVPESASDYKKQENYQNDGHMDETQHSEGDQKQDNKQNSSVETVGSLLNQMLGGTMLVLPILFSQGGIISGVLNMAVSGFISCKTCLIYDTHFKTQKEEDYQQSVRRILGNKYELIFRISKLAYLFLVLIVFFFLITIQFYQMVVFVIATSSDDGEKYYVGSNEQNQFVFDRFSIPYATIFNFCLCMFLVFQKNLVLLVKLAGYGAITIIAFCVFILYIFFANVFSSKFKDGTEELFNANIGPLAGTSAMAFQVHLNACTALKCNKVQKNNRRDLILNYIIGGSVYILIGVFGSLAIVGNCDTDISKAATINDCFKPTDPANLIIIVIYLFNIVTGFPIYFNIMKGAFFDLVCKGKEPNPKYVAIFNVCYLLLCCVIQNIPNIKPDILMSLNGAVCCFFFIYLVPIMMHIKCYHGSNKTMMTLKRSLSVIGIIKKDKPNSSRLQSLNDNLLMENKDLEQTNDEKHINTVFTEEKLLSDSQSQKQSYISNQDSDVSCNYHEESHNGKFKTLRIVLYSIVGLFGITLLVYEVYDVINTLVQGEKN